MNGLGNKANFAQRGFTLVELLIVVAIIALLSSIAIPAFIRLVWRARTSEALINLDAMAKSARAYYLSEHAAPDGEIVPRQLPEASMGAEDCCSVGSAGQCLGGYNGSQRFDSDPTFQVMNFGVDDPHRFAYRWESLTPYGTATADTFQGSCGDYLSYKAFTITITQNGQELSQGGVREIYTSPNGGGDDGSMMAP